MLQAVGGEPWLSKAALVVLGAVLASIFGFGSNWWRDRLASTRRQRIVARAIIAEVDRIRSFIGPRPETRWQALRLAAADPPPIHRWIERVIGEASEINASIVTLFVMLEETLARLAASRKFLRDWYSARPQFARSLDLLAGDVDLSGVDGAAEVRDALSRAEDDQGLAIHILGAIKHQVSHAARAFPSERAIAWLRRNESPAKRLSRALRRYRET